MKQGDFWSKSKDVVTLSRGMHGKMPRVLISLNKEKFYIGGKLYSDLQFYAMEHQIYPWEALDRLLRKALDEEDKYRDRY